MCTCLSLRVNVLFSYMQVEDDLVMIPYQLQKEHIFQQVPCGSRDMDIIKTPSRDFSLYFSTRIECVADPNKFFYLRGSCVCLHMSVCVNGCV